MAKQRRRQTQRETKEKNRQRMVIVFGVIMIGLMVLSLAPGLSPQTGDTQLTYGDIEFELQSRGNGGSVLVAELNGFEVEFQNLPTQVAYLDVDPRAISLIKGAHQVVLSADPNLEPYAAGLVDYARLQLGLGLQKTANAITEAQPAYTLPVVNCSQATAQVPVVVFNFANESSLIVEESCIKITAIDQELMRYKDRIIFEYYNIMSNGEILNE